MPEMDLTGRGMTSQRTRDRLVDRLMEQGITHPDVLAHMGSIPRHIFIDEALAHRAYEDTALPIGHGQTISQPFVVALMTQLLFNQPRPRVLEIGTGCGYQSAILSRMCERLWSIERIEALAVKAQERLAALRATNVRIKVGDGYAGWRVQAPFDGILVAAAPQATPPALLEQLAVGGRMIIPVGPGDVQELRVIDRTEAGLSEQVVEQVRFVPLQKGISRL